MRCVAAAARFIECDFEGTGSDVFSRMRAVLRGSIHIPGGDDVDSGRSRCTGDVGLVVISETCVSVEAWSGSGVVLLCISDSEEG